MAQSKQLVEYVSHELTKLGNSDFLALTYKRLDGEEPGKEFTTRVPLVKLNDTSKNLIKAKGKFVIVKTQEETPKGNFWWGWVQQSTSQAF